MGEAISLGRYSAARLTAVELYVVHGVVQTAHSRLGRIFAIALSRLGNGWVYIALAVGSVLAAGMKAVPLLAVGVLNALVLHAVYPIIKRIVARPRPYRQDTTLVPLLPALDENSFPSGHAMTLPAALVPLVLAFPSMLSLACAGWLLMAWARLASAHHYPSDVAVGTVLGVCVSYPISVYALAALRQVF
jgi:undecaprenyl-diphosphatase